ncbi:SMG9 [Cordylochernes scorpioides]|uniref:SMG9 n=1 Tax=Cordylochernes scorpioides TaxID=51811 RepID=A0ABY6LPL4_9ARAC|nr:SMG9 [Cordylochernes scorpioides]
MVAVFPVQTSEHLGHHCTRGVDLYITADRTILLDVQPLLSPSIMDLFYGEKKSTEYHNIDSNFYIQSLQLVSFLLSVCHTVLLVQDWFHDASLLRFIQTADMLKPSTHDSKASLEDLKDYNPQLVFVQNKCTRPDYYPDTIRDMHYLLSILFHNSKLKHSGLVSMDFIKEDDESANKVNLFLIPEIEGDSNVLERVVTDLTTLQYRGHPGWKQVCQSFCQQVMSLPRPNLTSQTFSEKNWFHFAGKTWDNIKKSNLYLEYKRLIL